MYISALVINIYFAECIIQNLPLPDIISHSDLYKLRNDMAIQLLNASGVFPLTNSVYNYTFDVPLCCICTDSLEDFCHGCGMCDHDSARYIDDSEWVSCYTNYYSVFIY